MNTKLKIALIRRYSDQGFSLPIAMGLGFIMILIAMTLLMRSQADQAIAKSQMRTAQSLSISELGLTRALAAMKKNFTLTGVDYNTQSPTFIDTWSGQLGADASLLVGTDPTAAANAPTRWISISTFGEFKIVSYNPDDPVPDNTGTLKVSGKTPEGNITTLAAQITYSNQAIAVVEWHREEAAN